MSLLEGLALHAELHLGNVFGCPTSWHVSISEALGVNGIQITIQLFGRHTLSRIVPRHSMSSPEGVESEAFTMACRLIGQLYRQFNESVPSGLSSRQTLAHLVDTVGLNHLYGREPHVPPPPPPVWTEGRVNWGTHPVGNVPGLPIPWEAFVVSVLNAAIDETPSFVSGEVLIGGIRFRSVSDLRSYVLNQIANVRSEARPSESQITAIPVQAQKPISHIRRIEL